MTAARAAAGEPLRRGVVALGWLSIGGTVVELAIERHWSSTIQFVPWAALAALALALGLSHRDTTGRRVRMVRAIALAVGLTALFGMYEHVHANHSAGYLDRRYERTWATTPRATRWWKAATRAVGPAPPLAPAILAEAACCVWLTTVGLGRDPSVTARPAPRSSRSA